MNTNTIDRLRQLAPPAGPVGEDIVQQDVSRGRVAVRRAHLRQAWTAVGIGGFALAAIIVGGSILPTMQAAPDTQADAGSGTASVTGQPAMQLVSYTGVQPDGYHLDKVPEGFAVATSDTLTLILAPTGKEAALANENPETYIGQIVISKQGTFDYTKDKRDVTINGAPAVIALSDRDEPATEVQFDTDGTTVNIQIWNNIRLTDQQIIEFAQSISVIGEPGATVG